MQTEKQSLIEKAVSLDENLIRNTPQSEAIKAEASAKRARVNTRRGSGHDAGELSPINNERTPALNKRGREVTSGGTQVASEERTIVPTSLKKRGPSTPTSTGGTHYLLDPRPEDINWRDIAAHLAKINRYTGATPLPYSVAQHCVIMCDLVLPELKAYALLHDAHEAYINDLSAPFKAALALINPPALASIKHIEQLQDIAIYAAANLTYPVPDYIKRRIKDLDLAMASAEIEQLLCRPARDCVASAKTIIRPKSWGDAEDQYMARLEQWVFPNIRIKNFSPEKTPTRGSEPRERGNSSSRRR